METNNIIIHLEQFLQEEKNQNLFHYLGKELSVQNNTITLYNTKWFKNSFINQDKISNLSIFSDQNSFLRLKNQDLDLTFRLKQNHFFISNFFIKRSNKENFLLVKKEDEYSIQHHKNQTHTFFMIKKKNIHIDSYSSEEQNHFFYCSEQNNMKNDIAKNKVKSYFIDLEEAVPTITGIIAQEFPILNECIYDCFQKKKQKIIVFPQKKEF